MKSFSLSLASKRVSISILYPWEPHSMLSAQHFDSPRNLAWCLLRQRAASKGASKHYGSQHNKRFKLLTGEASNSDPQLTVHHLNPLNKCLYRQYIHPLRIYSTCDKKNQCIFYPRRLASRRVGCTAENCGWPMTVSAPDYLGLAVHTFCKEDTHTDVVLHWGAFVR